MNKELQISYDFYKKYHSNRYNKIIHYVTIPIIYWSSMGLINNNKFLRSINLDFFIYYYLTYKYINYNFKIGIICGLFYSFLLFNTKDNKRSNKKYLKYNLSAWLLQFLGHYIEGKRPALVDNLVTSFTTAPFFVFYDLLKKKNLLNYLFT